MPDCSFLLKGISGILKVYHGVALKIPTRDSLVICKLAATMSLVIKSHLWESEVIAHHHFYPSHTYLKWLCS